MVYVLRTIQICLIWFVLVWFGRVKAAREICGVGIVRSINRKTRNTSITSDILDIAATGVKNDRPQTERPWVNTSRQDRHIRRKHVMDWLHNAN